MEQGKRRGNVPNVDVIRLLRGELAHELATFSGVSIFTMGGSPRSNSGRATLDMSGPATATRGALAVEFARLRTSKFHIGPPTSITLVIPLRR